MERKKQATSQADPHRPIHTIGFVGLGIMGQPMAGNLLRAGYEMLVWNRTPGRTEPLVEQGAAAVKSPADIAARGPDVICLNVTDTPDVEQVLFGETGVARAAKQGLIVVDHSTISPVATRDFADRLAELGVTLVDAPVSGGDVGARDGTLSIMVGGPDDAVQRVQPMLSCLGSSVVHLGETGLGQACKACNQAAVAVNLMGVCEAMALARKSGLDAQKMIDALAGGAAGSWQLENLGPKIAAGDHEPGFMIELMLKDLAIIADTARVRDLPLAGVNLAEGYLRAVAAAGGGQLGTQAMARTLEKLGAFDYST
ncbi:MAG: NAD(P)-dependent oxidoreductase [Phycisphaeraceae bacterium]